MDLEAAPLSNAQKETIPGTVLLSPPYFGSFFPIDTYDAGELYPSDVSVWQNMSGKTMYWLVQETAPSTDPEQPRTDVYRRLDTPESLLSYLEGYGHTPRSVQESLQKGALVEGENYAFSETELAAFSAIEQMKRQEEWELQEAEIYEIEAQTQRRLELASQRAFEAAADGTTVESRFRPEGTSYTIHANDERCAAFDVWECAQDGTTYWLVEKRLDQYQFYQAYDIDNGDFAQSYTRHNTPEGLLAHLTKESDIPQSAMDAISQGSLAGTDTYLFAPEEVMRITPVWVSTDRKEYNPDFYDIQAWETLSEAACRSRAHLGSQHMSTIVRLNDGIDGRTDSPINPRTEQRYEPGYQEFFKFDNQRQLVQELEATKPLSDSDVVRMMQLADISIDRNDPDSRKLRALDVVARIDYIQQKQPLDSVFFTRLAEVGKSHADPAMGGLLQTIGARVLQERQNAPPQAASKGHKHGAASETPHDR